MSENAIVTNQSKALTSITNSTLDTIKKYQKEGKLQLPKNYSADNAIKQLQLKIVDDPKLMACTPASIANTMLNMAILGLNPAKEQCYPIPYGDKAQLFVSYQGRKAIAKRIDPTIKDIIANTIKKGEEFEFEDQLDGSVKILKHQRTLESMDRKDIIAGYATIIYNDGKENQSLIMTWDRIKESWKMSKVKPIDENGNVKSDSIHSRFMDEMVKRTLIRAITKPIINSSDDNDLFCDIAKQVEYETDAAEAKQEAEEKTASKKDAVDVDFEEYNDIEVDENTGEVIDSENV